MEELIAEGRVVQTEARRRPSVASATSMRCAGVPLQDIWTDIAPVNSQASERTRLRHAEARGAARADHRGVDATQGDLVADFFCGSGTTPAVAEKLGRRWIGCDLGRFAIHTTRKRLLEHP